MQIVATGLMVVLFKQKNFAIGAGLAKCEAPVSAVLGIMFFGTTLSLYGWVGVIIGGIAVMMFSLSGGIRTISWKTAGIGLASSTAFALTSLWVREASLVLEGHFLLRASWVLLVVILFQTLILVGYMWLRERADLTLMLCRPKLVVLTSIASFLGSFGWFHAMSLKAVPYVKTLGQVEIFFMMIVSVVYLKAPIPKKDMFALMLVAIAAILVMWPQA
jgi:drug/metabolite transporter (DMT)-like permease